MRTPNSRIRSRTENVSTPKIPTAASASAIPANVLTSTARKRGDRVAPPPLRPSSAAASAADPCRGRRSPRAPRVGGRRGIAGDLQGDRAAVPRVLLDRHVDLHRLLFLAGADRDLLDDADDLARDRRRDAGRHVRHLDDRPDRLASAQKAAHELFVDDADLWRGGDVAIGECAPRTIGMPSVSKYRGLVS